MTGSEVPGYASAAADPLSAKNICFYGAFGFVYGIVVTKGVVFLPSVLAGTSSGAFLLLTKFLLAAITASLIAGCVVSQCGDELRQRFGVMRNTERRNVILTALGGGCMGWGLVLAGTMYEALFTQTGLGMTLMLYTLLGGIITVFVLGVASGAVGCNRDWIQRRCCLPHSTLDQLLQLDYLPVSLVTGTLLLVFCYLLETLWTNPWPTQLPLTIHAAYSSSFLPTSWDGVWNPYFAGACFGVLQCAFRLVAYSPVDGTLIPVVPVAIPLSWLGRQLHYEGPVLHWFHRHNHVSQLWVWVFFLSTAAGASFANAALGSPVGYQRQSNAEECFWAGALLTLGAILADMGPVSLALSSLGDLNLTGLCGTLSMALAAAVTHDVLQQKITLPRPPQLRFTIWQ